MSENTTHKHLHLVRPQRQSFYIHFKWSKHSLWIFSDSSKPVMTVGKIKALFSSANIFSQHFFSIKSDFQPSVWRFAPNWYSKRIFAFEKEVVVVHVLAFLENRLRNIFSSKVFMNTTFILKRPYTFILKSEKNDLLYFLSNSSFSH